MAIRDHVLKSLEEARQQKLIGSGLEAQLKLSAAAPVFDLLHRHHADLRYLFIVSSVELVQAAGGNGAEGIHVEVAKAAGAKCDRCWNYSVHVGEDAKYPTVCERCSQALREMEPGVVASKV